MTFIRKLVLALCLAGSFSYSNAQVDTTGNLITSGQEHTWTGATPGSYGMACPPNGGACTGGPGALYDPSTDTIYYSWGQSTVSQTFAINQALSAAGTGIQVQGYYYSWEIQNNNNYRTDQAGTDRLIASVTTYNADGTARQTDSWTYDTKFDWTTFSGTVNYNNPAAVSQLGNLTVSFAGSDSGIWGGYFGPQVRNIGISLLYNSDPCAANPLISPDCDGYEVAYFNLMCSNNPLHDPTCPGHDAIVTSANLVPRPGDGSGWISGWLNNSFAINQALSHAGAGVMIHGFNWGYRALNFNLFGGDMGNSTVNVNIRDGDGTSLHAWSRNNTSYGENWYSSSYVFPQSRNNTTLGNFDFTATTSGWGYVDNMWARAIFTPDSCSLDPLSSVLCTGYEAAFLAQQCGITALFSPQCPGYIDAMNSMLAQSSITGITDVVAVSSITGTSITETTGTQDATRDPAEVREDVGGAEMTTDGTIVVSDGIPSDSKKSIAESSNNETQGSKSTLNSSQLLSLAQRAAREAEKTALSAAEDAVDASLSDDANPADGIGLGDITGVRILQGLGNNNSIAADNETMINSRGRNNTEETTEVSSETVKEETRDSLEITTNPLAVEQKEEVAKAGPSVRRGGSIEGMEGGADISELARVPMDFNQYLDQQIKDAQFYASKDIYRGQKNVDNARALRGLGTDRLHQEMVDQQYNQGAR